MKLAVDLISECHQLPFAFSIQKISSTLHLYTHTHTHTHRVNVAERAYNT